MVLGTFRLWRAMKAFTAQLPVRARGDARSHRAGCGASRNHGYPAYQARTRPRRPPAASSQRGFSHLRHVAANPPVPREMARPRARRHRPQPVHFQRRGRRRRRRTPGSSAGRRANLVWLESHRGGLSARGEFSALCNFHSALIHCPNFTDSILKSVSPWTNLRILTLQGNLETVTDVGWQCLATLPNLEELQLHGALSESAPTKQLARLTRLRTLELFAPCAAVESLWESLPDCRIKPFPGAVPRAAQIDRISLRAYSYGLPSPGNSSEPVLLAAVEDRHQIEAVRQWFEAHGQDWRTRMGGPANVRMQIDFEGKTQAICQVWLRPGAMGIDQVSKEITDSELQAILALFGATSAQLDER